MSLKDFGYKTQVTADSFDAVVARVTEALKAQGFGVLTEIDFQAAFAKKLGVDYPKYTILGACNPPLAHVALGEDTDAGLLLPCNVVVREVDGGAAYEVNILNPGAMFAAVDEPALAEVAAQANDKLAAAFAALKGA